MSQNYSIFSRISLKAKNCVSKVSKSGFDLYAGLKILSSLQNVFFEFFTFGKITVLYVTYRTKDSHSNPVFSACVNSHTELGKWTHRSVFSAHVLGMFLQQQLVTQFEHTHFRYTKVASPKTHNKLADSVCRQFWWLYVLLVTMHAVCTVKNLKKLVIFLGIGAAWKLAHSILHLNR